MHKYVTINCQSSKRIINRLLWWSVKRKESMLLRSPSIKDNIKTKTWKRKTAFQRVLGDPSWPVGLGKGGLCETVPTPLLTCGVWVINGGLNLEFILQVIKLSRLNSSEKGWRKVLTSSSPSFCLEKQLPVKVSHRVIESQKRAGGLGPHPAFNTPNAISHKAAYLLAADPFHFPF